MESYTLATQNGSMHNGFTNLLTLLPSKQVSFEDDLTDTCVPLEEIPTSTDDKHNTTTEPPSRRTSVVSLDSLLRYKLALCFGICCICVLFLLPIILYYTEGSGDGRTPNTSESTLCYESMEEEFNYTYEQLKQFPFCESQLFSLLCNCTDDSCVRHVMCQEVRQEYCTSEWRMLELNKSEKLINCTRYGETASLNCSSQFGLAENGSTCKPLCKKFSPYSDTFTTFFTTWIFIFNAVSVVGGIISVVVSLYKIKKLFHYPQILIVMNSILISVLSLVLLMSSIPFGDWKPLCSNEFLHFDGSDEQNGFCKFQGFMNFAIISLYCYFWLLYTLHLLLRTTYPLRMFRLEESKYSRMVHITEVTVVVLIATIPHIVITTKSKFMIITFPALNCSPGPVHSFYGLIVPTVLVCGSSLVMMLFVLYNIHIKRGLFKRRSKGYRKLCSIKFSIPEVKIFVTFCYLLIVMVFLWTGFSVSNARLNNILTDIQNYVQCMSGGILIGRNCEPYRRALEANTMPGLFLIYFTLFQFLSYSNLPFLIQFKTVKVFVARTARKLSTRKSSSITADQMASSVNNS